jgi:hypothetical protein
MAHDLALGKTRRNWSRSWQSGSLLLPEKQQKEIFRKVDDVRYDLRRATRIFGIGLLCLSAGIGLVGVAGIFRVARRGV